MRNFCTLVDELSDPRVPEKGQLYQEAVTIELVTVNVFMSFPLIHVMPEMQMFYHSTVVNHSKCMGIEPIATELARQSLPLAKDKAFPTQLRKVNPVLEAVEESTIQAEAFPISDSQITPRMHTSYTAV